MVNVLEEEETSHDSPIVVTELTSDRRGSTVMSTNRNEQFSIDSFEESDIL